MPVPDIHQLRAGIAGADEQRQENLRARVHRLQQGTDQADDMSTIASWVASLTDVRAIAPAGRSDTAMNDPTPSPSPVVPRDNSRKWEPSHHVYGSKAALCFEPTVIEAVPQAREEPFHTLMVEMAEAARKNSYDWERKISFRLTKRELPLFTAWLFGWCPRLELSGHGAANNKTLMLEDQTSNLFVRLKQGRRVLATPVGGEEVAAIASLALKAMHLNAPHLDSQTLLQVVKRCGGMYYRSVAAPAAEA